MDFSLLDYFDDEESKKDLLYLDCVKGEKILRSYDETKFLCQIMEGLVKLYSVDSNGRIYISVIYGPGDLFPLAWFIGVKRPAVFVESLTVSKMLLVPIKLMQEKLNKDLALHSAFTKKVVGQFAYYATTVNNLGQKYGKSRLAYILLVIAARFGEHKRDGIHIPAIHHSDLGNAVKMTRESVTKELSRLESLNVIEYDRSVIKIKNRDALQKEVDKNVSIIFFDNI